LAHQAWFVEGKDAIAVGVVRNLVRRPQFDERDASAGLVIYNFYSETIRALRSWQWAENESKKRDKERSHRRSTFTA
jgi:hypothetical protein